jgi:hypothetical protein
MDDANNVCSRKASVAATGSERREARRARGPRKRRDPAANATATALVASAAAELEAAGVKRLLTPRALEEWLGIPQGTQRWQRSRGEGPPFLRLGDRTIRYDVRAVEAWLATRGAR